ncbi:hypothetical protein EWM64_g4749 [Hericium alpestre]|uniref:Cytochrome P450 n=1 Tax=Hericium alpestre TaxID=135208 RepID=A0A4Y9ZYZ0_9AGAM|nr:hypothetical protein EWM64_g4749 [Hericium alpestre]
MFDPPDAWTFILWTLILSTVVLLYRNSKRCYGFPLPPGPIPFPVIGNVLSAQTRTPWVTYAEWSRKYNSELVSFTVFGQMYIVVNSLRAAKEIFETRSAMYSSRPYMTMVDMIGWYFNLGLLPYGDAWRARRRLLHLRLAAGRAPSYFPLQMQKSAEVIRKLYDDPDEVLSHMRVAVTSLTMEIAYGHEVAPKDDPFVALAEEAVAAVSDAALPGAIVNAFPFLSILVAVKAQGTARPSLASSWIIENKDSHPGADAERVAKDASGIIYVGGVDTTVATLMTAVRALALNPTVQANAQAEIDGVVGRSRLPTFDDRPDLPYVGAVIREVMRSHQALPLSVVRTVEKDDAYMGMSIPKGQHLAEATAWITVASVLAVYTVSKAKNTHGDEIPVEVAASDGIVSHPSPFQSSIKPRDAVAETLLKSLRKNPS